MWQEDSSTSLKPSWVTPSFSMTTEVSLYHFREWTPPGQTMPSCIIGELSTCLEAWITAKLAPRQSKVWHHASLTQSRKMPGRTSPPWVRQDRPSVYASSTISMFSHSAAKSWWKEHPWRARDRTTTLSPKWKCTILIETTGRSLTTLMSKTSWELYIQVPSSQQERGS